MTAGHEDARGTGRAGQHGQHGQHGEHGEQRGNGEYREHAEYDGMDALMAAITGDPLPEEARRDPAFLAEHREAEADVAVLREQLVRLAGALTGEGSNEVEAEASPDAVSAPLPVRRPRGRTRPAAPTRTAGPPRPGRGSGPRRALRIALGSLAGAAAFSLVLGFGWLVAQGGGGADDKSGASSAAKGDVGSAGQEAGAGGRPADPERELACSRLVVEGTVARVEREKDAPGSAASGSAAPGSGPGSAASAPGSRVTLTVVRSYRPAHGPAEVRFLLHGDARPAPRAGQHVLVRVGQGERYASLWAVGDSRVAAARAWITEALPGSRTLPCPSGDAS
ncbi:hypothetical protein ABZV75_23210 [Streptomyces flaveolus]|uniref:hypothetical protein n=1 Tax=Streptomyces flaveolus TaxID=67297 RepID=UPI00339F28EC